MENDGKEIIKPEYKQFIKFVKSYQKFSKLYSPDEHIEKVLEEKEFSYSDFVLQNFLKFTRHERIFLCLVEYFGSICKITEDESFYLLMLFYLIVFELNENTYDNLVEMFKSVKSRVKIDFFNYIIKEDFLILLTETTCKIFGSDYTTNTIIQPLLLNLKLIDKLHKQFVDVHEKQKHKRFTIPVSPREGLAKHKTIVTPVENEVPPPRFQSTKVPRTTYQPCDAVRKNLDFEYFKNRLKAKQLLDTAKEQLLSNTQMKTSNESTINEPKITKIKAKKPPKFKPVEIKPNAATLMREAAQMVKKCEAEIKKIDNLANNAYNYSLYEELEEKERKKIQQQYLQTIQKNHLQGLLTREEAILAKQKIIKLNREKMEEFKTEKIELCKKLDEWRQQEQEKIKVLVEKSQNIEKNAKEAQKEVIEDKQRTVKMIQEEKKELMNKVMEEKNKELNRKIELIRDLKALQSLKDLNKKEFDPTETANLGLMCEMSIAELQERLFLLKVEVEDDLQHKRKLITETRKQRQELLEQAQQFIIQNKPLKEKSKKAEQMQLEDTAEIMALRKRIDEARKLRLENDIMT